MNKELTPLEALEKLTNYKCSCMSEKVECKKVIEKALKDYEKLKQDYSTLHNFYTLLNIETKKEHIALKIIKECFELNGFDELIPNSKWFESEEKQDLLKEVLL